MSDCGNCNVDHNDTGLLDEYSSGKGSAEGGKGKYYREKLHLQWLQREI